MKVYNILILTLVAVLVMMAPASAEIIYCDNCSDCSIKIENANASDVVMLTQDISNFDGNCICFNDSDMIVFDGGGHTIDGVNTGGRGVYLSAYSNSNVIRNFTVTDFDSGIYVWSADNNEIYDVVANYNDDGISLMDSDGNNIHDCIVQENRWADVYFCLRAERDCDNTFTNVTGSGGRPIGYYVGEHHISDMEFSSLCLANADNSTVDNVTVYGSSTYTNNGIRLSYSDNVTMTNIRSLENFNGVYMDESYGNSLDGVYCNHTYLGGAEAAAIYASDSDYNYFKNVTGEYCGQTGIRLFHSDYNVIDGANITDSTYGGIRLSYSYYNVVNNSYVGETSNGDGIVVSRSEFNLIYNNWFDNDDNVFVNSYNVNDTNVWNVTNRTGPNIFGGAFIGGNYWSDYSGHHTRPDGFGDEPYVIDENNTDYLPLVIDGEPDMWIRNDGYDIEVGGTFEYLVTCRNGSNIDVNCTNLTWTSDNETVGTVVWSADDAAIITGHAVGVTNVTVTGCGNLTDTVVQNVTDRSGVCGDVDENGYVSSNDVIQTYRRSLDPGYPLASEWAADADGNGYVSSNDVIEIYRKSLNPSYELNCAC